MNSIEEYQNILELLKRALEFYADTRNYEGSMGTVASIALDEYGSQARFALAKIKEIKDGEEKMQSDYDKIVNNMSDEINKNPMANIDYGKLIEEYRKLNKDIDYI